MIYIAKLPWMLKIDGEEQVDAALFAVDEKTGFKCEFEGDPAASKCSPQPYAIGSSDEREPKFCFKHYFEGCEGDGENGYQLVAHHSI